MRIDLLVGVSLAAAIAALSGCKYIADVGPKPMVMPAYPVQNVPAQLPAPRQWAPQQPYPDLNSPVRTPSKSQSSPVRTAAHGR